MTPLVVAGIAGYGVHLLWTALALRWRGLGPGPGGRTRRSRAPDRRLTAPTGTGSRAVAGGLVVAALTGGLAGGVVFASPAAAVAGAGACATAVASVHRDRIRRRRREAADGWPLLLEEVRVRTCSLGRSIPQALFEAAERAPEDLREAFAVARREWSLSADLSRTLAVVRRLLPDATTDMVCETLLVAHEVGGGDLDRRLGDLVADRLDDLSARRDAEARQAGARFARRFVLLVPVGMTLAGLSIGEGRAAYRTPAGQLAVTVAAAVVAVCWWWAGRIMAVPEPPRIFADPAPGRVPSGPGEGTP